MDYPFLRGLWLSVFLLKKRNEKSLHTFTHRVGSVPHTTLFAIFAIILTIAKIVSVLLVHNRPIPQPILINQCMIILLSV